MSFLYRIFSDFCLKSCVLQLDDGTYNCQRCGKSRSKPVKTLCITSLPKILVIHIKRFEHVRIILKDFFLADFTRTIHKLVVKRIYRIFGYSFVEINSNEYYCRTNIR